MERSATPTTLVKRDKLDLSSLASPKGEMESSFSWTYLFKSPTSSTLCFSKPTVRKLNQVKLFCNPISSTLCDFTLGKLSQETEFHITKHTPLVHTGTPLSVPKSSSGTNRVSDCQSRLVTTSSSRWIPDKPKIEVTKALIHHIGKTGEHFYGENFIHEYPKSWRHIKSNQNMGTHHTFNNCVRETFNHGLSPSEVDWGDAMDLPIKHGPNYTSNGCILMDVDWGDKLKLKYTSYGCMLMEIDWGGKFNCTSWGCPMTNWQGHETHPTGHNTSEVDWGGHDPNPNHMNESLLSEVDWGAHDSSVFNRKCTKTLSKAPCLVALRMSLTLHLLLFTQSMWVLIAMGFKYLILMEGKMYLIENQDDEMLGLFVFLHEMNNFWLVWSSGVKICLT